MTTISEQLDAAVADALDPIIDEALAEGRLAGGVALVAKRGKLVYARAAGLADVEIDRPMARDTIFLAASLTKPIVTAAFLSLVEDGVMVMDDPITKYLPTFTPAFEGKTPQITLRQLLTHTSGLSYGFLQPADGPYLRLGVSDGLNEPGRSFADNLSRIVEAGLFFPPGAAWLYSVSMDVLGAAMEAATGKTLPQVVSERVADKLGMDDSGFTVTDRARLATHYADGPPPVPMGDNFTFPFADLSGIRFTPGRIFDQTSFPSGGGGMACTAPDLLTFLEAIRTGGAPIVKPETATAMMTNQTGAHELLLTGPGWGFGFGGSVLRDPTPTASRLPVGTWTWGGVYGHSWAVDPATETSFVLMTNTTVEGMAGPLSVDLMAAALA
tara:strand:+ start:75547 stop:76698 length:1152 start_codon:yes stop_codon:yes gene_type:complete